jgi:hypothetical protein
MSAARFGLKAGARLAAALLLLTCLPSAAQGFGEDPRENETPTVCQGDAEGARALLRQGIENYVALMAARDISVIAPRVDRPVESAAEWLRARAPRDAIIFFGRSGDRHCAYLVNTNGVAAFGATAASASVLSQALDAWRTSANIDAPVRGRRAATSRSAPAMAQAAARAPSGPRPGRASLEYLAQTLFPGEIRAMMLQYHHLYLLPYGDLGEVPYAALPAGVGDTQIIDYATVSIAPNLNVFLGEDVAPRSSQTRVCNARSPGQSALVVGNPTAPQDAEWTFPNLPGAEREAGQVAQTLNATPLVGAAATRDTFLERAARARIVHLASHGIASTSDPLNESFLVFTDGRLTAGRIQQTCVPARLVVLSACQTGLGRAHAGGIIGLARAFQIASADEVITSLWSVDDEVTERLMTRFWSIYARGDVTAADALRAAMLEVRRTNPNPRLWAAFVVFGAPGTT